MTADQYVNAIVEKHRLPDTLDNYTSIYVVSPLKKIISNWAGACLCETKLSGSRAKGTAIDLSTDLDLFISLSSTARNSLEEIYNSLYNRMPEWEEAFRQLTLQDCVDYVYNVTINRTYDGYIREKSVVNDGLAKKFKDIIFEETDPELDHAGDIDYVAKIGRWQIGIQIKPVTAKANFGGFSLSERMKASFADFTEKYGGNVFVVYSLKGEIANMEVVDAISAEIDRLKSNP